MKKIILAVLVSMFLLVGMASCDAGSEGDWWIDSLQGKWRSVNGSMKMTIDGNHLSYFHSPSGNTQTGSLEYDYQERTITWHRIGGEGYYARTFISKAFVSTNDDYTKGRLNLVPVDGNQLLESWWKRDE
jgi:hypothetical protein